LYDGSKRGRTIEGKRGEKRAARQIDEGGNRFHRTISKTLTWKRPRENRVGNPVEWKRERTYVHYRLNSMSAALNSDLGKIKPFKRRTKRIKMSGVAPVK